jgi:hypothetical protein
MTRQDPGEYSLYPVPVTTLARGDTVLVHGTATSVLGPATWDGHTWHLPTVLCTVNLPAGRLVRLVVPNW